MKYITQTRDAKIDNIPKVFFSSHDHDKHFFEEICDLLFKYVDCAVFYEDNPCINKDYDFELSQMNLTIIPVTKSFLYDECFARCNILKTIQESHYPVLPILYDSNYESEFDRICGNIHIINRRDSLLSEPEADNNLKRILELFLYDNNLIAEIDKLFSTSLFISYRKKDIKSAYKTIKKIHENEELVDVSIWYDAFLTPGEDFNENIKSNLINSNAVIMVITPNVVKESNYIMTTEYPLSISENKLVIPIEVRKTNRHLIETHYPKIPECLNIRNINDIHSKILELKNTDNYESIDEVEKLFLLGMAYLKGIKVEININKSIELLTRAAKSNCIPAIENLIELNEKGIGQKINYKAALKWQKLKIKLLKDKSDYKEQIKDLEYLGYLYNQNAKYAKAINAYKTALEKKSSDPGVSSIDLASSNNCLGMTYTHLGNLENAIKHFEKAILILKNSNANNSLEAASILNNLGSSYRQIGNYSKALHYLNAALKIRKKLLKPGHIDIASILNNIGLTYDNLCDYSESLKHYNLALEILERYYGTNHPRIAILYDNIGSIYNIKSEYDVALKYYKSSLKIKKIIYGENHPETATSYNNIASLYHELGDYQKSLDYSDLTLKILERFLGEYHPITATMYNNIGILQYKLKRYESALDFHFKALKIRKNIFENDQNIHVAESYLNIGTVYGDIKEYDKAFEYCNMAMKIYITIYGDNHIAVSNCYNNLGSVYYQKCDFKNAIKFYSMALDIKINILGVDSLFTANIQSNIGFAYKGLGDLSQALSYFKNSLKVKEKILGKENENVKEIYDQINELTQL